MHDLKTVKLALPFHAEEVCPYLKDLASDYGVNLHFEMLNNSRESIGNFFRTMKMPPFSLSADLLGRF